jgi:hypothetical protein
LDGSNGSGTALAETRPNDRKQEERNKIEE